MKLVLYSSGLHHADHEMNFSVWQLIGKSSPSMLMLVASPDAYDFVVPKFSTYLQEFGSSHAIEAILPEKAPINDLRKKIEQTDLLFLSGGNTYYFLNTIRKLGLISNILAFAKNGGVLVGSSAGSILMTPTIATSAIPHDDADSNEVKITDYSALNLVKFEVSPHYKDSENHNAELRKYTVTSGRPLYALADGTGIIVDGNKEKLFGSITLFDNGNQSKIQCEC